ncbi:MAG: radical SAM protein [bacterium]
MFFIASLPEDEMTIRQFPLGAGSVAAWVQREEPDIEIRITATPEDVFSWKPDLLAISSVTQCYNGARRLARRAVDELGIPVVLGGYHISAVPHLLDPEFTAGVIGEGEWPMAALVRRYRELGNLPAQVLRNIPGLCYHDPLSGVVINERPRPIPMDTLPRPVRNISRGARNIMMFSSRGCAYRCRYCASSRHWGKLRLHTARRFVDDLHDLVERYDAASIRLQDDLFFADRRRIHEIVRLMDAEGLLGRMSFHGFITSNLADEETFAAAKRMGFHTIRFGAETGSDRLLKLMKGRWASVENHQRCIDLGRRFGIGISAAFMLGTPGETREDLEQTAAFIERNAGRLEIEGFYLTTPIPGTPYWDFALERGLVSEPMDWDRLNLDFAKTRSFGFDTCLYLNGENVPLEVVREYHERITAVATMVV